MLIDLTAGWSISGGTYPCPSYTESAGSSNHLFYSTSGNTFNGRAGATLAGQAGITQSILTNRWSVRQTTCGASAGDTCDANGGFAGVNMTPEDTCSLKTEALLVLPTQQFVLQLAADNALVTDTSSPLVTTHTWWGPPPPCSLSRPCVLSKTDRHPPNRNMYTVEYASTAPAVISGLGVDQFQTRVTPSRFQLAVYPTGQVVQVKRLSPQLPPKKRAPAPPPKKPRG